MALDRDRLQQALAKIKLLVLDVDGVMTDGGLYLGAREEMKRYNSRDGAGIKYAMRFGVGVAVITGRESESVTRRCSELGIAEVHQKQLDKLPALTGLLERLGLKPEEAAVMGDDLMELPMMREAGLGIAVADSAPEVRRHADYVTRTRGGEGAIREVVEMILKAKGLWGKVLERYLG